MSQLRAEPHPIAGHLYEELGNGLVKVTKGDQYGIFQIDGRWVEGELTHADPHLLIYVGGAQLPAGLDIPKERMPVPGKDAEDQNIAAREYAGDAIAQQQVQQGMPVVGRVVAPYVGDPGKDTAWGPRSKGWFSKEELVAGDRYPDRLPDIYRHESPMPGGPTKIRADRFVKREYHDLEVEKLWKRVWQMACREDDIPEVGDYHVYEIATLSFLIVRTAPTEFKAYYNACLHRGRLLREFSGKTATEFRCPYHGWSWRIDGSLKEMTCEWDFGADVREDVAKLPEAKVGTWGGFIFINPDLEAGSLEDFLGPAMLTFYEKFELHKRYKQVHVAKIFNGNWKATQEAFREAYHVIATHPQLVLAGGDGATTHLDVYGNFCRGVSEPVYGVSPHRGIYKTQEEATVQRQLSADLARKYLEPIIGERIDQFSDTELNDSNFNDLFPNLNPYGAFGRIVFRFRPYGDNHERAIMDVYYLAPWPDDVPKPPAVPVKWLGDDQPWADAPELGMLSRIIEQDVYNVPKLQAGLKAMRDGYIWYSRYQEGKIRNFHRRYEECLELEPETFEKKGK